MTDVGELNRAGQEQEETDRVGRRVRIGNLNRFAKRNAVASIIGQ